MVEHQAIGTWEKFGLVRASQSTTVLERLKGTAWLWGRLGVRHRLLLVRAPLLDYQAAMGTGQVATPWSQQDCRLQVCGAVRFSAGGLSSQGDAGDLARLGRS